MINYARSALALTLFVALATPFAALADSIGISPSKIERMVYQGDVLHEEATLSKSSDVGDMFFDVSYSGSAPVGLLGQNELSILDGQNTVTFPFDIDATNSDVGDYDGRISFVLVPDAAMRDAGGTSIVLGVGIKLVVHVLPRPEPSAVLNATEYPPALKDISMRDLSARSTAVSGGHRIRLSWVVDNAGENPVSNVPTDIFITQQGNEMFGKRIVLSSEVPARGTATQSYDYLVSSGSEDGRYNVSVGVGETSDTSFAWVGWEVIARRAIIAFVCALLAGAVGFAAYRLSRLKGRHH